MATLAQVMCTVLTSW